MSDNLTIIWDELPSSAVIADANDAGNDVSALLDPRRSRKVTIVGSPPKITIDRGGETGFSAIAIVDPGDCGDALMSASLTEGGTVTSTETIPAPLTDYSTAPDTGYTTLTDNADGYPGRSVAIMCLPWVTNSHYYHRYLTIEWPEATSVTLGRVMVGRYWRPNHNIGFGWKTTPTDPSTIMRSIGGQRWTDARDTYMQISASLKYLDEDEAYGDILPISMLAARDPCVLSVSPGTALSSVLDLYGYMSPVAVTHAGPGRFDANINFEEAL